MENKHTPGPWEVKQSVTRNCSFTEIHRQGSLKPIARTIIRKGISEEVAEANAELIAAAPELLEALELMVEAAETMLDIFKGDEADDSRLGIAKAAIKKARGE